MGKKILDCCVQPYVPDYVEFSWDRGFSIVHIWDTGNTYELVQCASIFALVMYFAAMKTVSVCFVNYGFWLLVVIAHGICFI